jgi:starch synthase
VSRVGGLVDTVRDADEDASGGTGLMCDPTVEGLRDALDRALKLFGNKPRYAAVQRRGMMRDFSWKTAATAFEALYRDSL